jgi:putative transposase
VTAEGERVTNPRYYRKPERALTKATRRVARRKKGSKRWWKAVHQCAKQHQKVKRQRRDFHHKTALALVRQYAARHLEALQIRDMRRRPQPKLDGNSGYLQNGARRRAGLNTSISDAGWYAFRRILACKAAWAGKRVEAIPPAYTSLECSGCGERIYKSLSVRTHVCTSCGLMLDRDENAALTILRAGQARQAPTWVDAPSVA